MITPERRKEILDKYNRSEKRKATSKRYYEKHKQEIKKRTEAYRRSPEYKMIRNASKYKRRALEKDTDINKKDLLDLMTRTKTCMICDCELTDENRQLDHITPLSAGGKHYMDNVRFVCANCNQTRPKDGRDEAESMNRFMQALLNPQNWDFHIDIHTSI